MTEEQADTASLGFGQYIFVLKRQWRLVFVAAVIGAVAAAGYLFVSPSTATATTTINLNVITTEPFSAQRAASGLLDDATETAIARSHVVAARASDLLKGRVSASEIRKSSTVTTTSGAAIVTVDYDAPSAAAAVRGADAVASAYLSFRSDQAEQRIKVMVSKLTERIDALNATLGQVNQQLASASANSAEYAQATTQRQQILTELDGLLSERNGLQSVDTTGGTVLSAAEDNDIEYAPKRTITLLTGTAAGGVIGIVAAFFWNPFDRRLRDAAEVARDLEAPVFASIDARSEAIPAQGTQAGALRVARERLLADVHLGSTLLVIDATHGEVTSSTAINLAVVTAQAGYDVRLMAPEDGESLRSRLKAPLDLEESDDSEVRSATVPSLEVAVTSDVGKDGEGDILLTAEARAAVDGVGGASLGVLVLPSDAHPASLLAALRLARSVVVVGRARRTTSTELRWIREEAEGIDTPVLGAVVEQSERRARRRRASRGADR